MGNVAWHDIQANWERYSVIQFILLQLDRQGFVVDVALDNIDAEETPTEEPETPCFRMFQMLGASADLQFLCHFMEGHGIVAKLEGYPHLEMARRQISRTLSEEWVMKTKIRHDNSSKHVRVRPSSSSSTEAHAGDEYSDALTFTEAMAVPLNGQSEVSTRGSTYPKYSGRECTTDLIAILNKIDASRDQEAEVVEEEPEQRGKSTH